MDGIAAVLIAPDPVPGRTGAEGGPPAREWRVLHRLEKPAIGAHEPDGARLPGEQRNPVVLEKIRIGLDGAGGKLQNRAASGKVRVGPSQSPRAL